MANDTINKQLDKKYEFGFTTDIEQETLPPGLDEDVIKIISGKKNEPDWLLNWRLNAFKKWKKMTEPKWAKINYPEIDYQKISYFSAPKKSNLKSLNEVDPEILKTYNKLGIPIEEQKMLAGVAVDAVLIVCLLLLHLRKIWQKQELFFAHSLKLFKNIQN